jgi:small neutral amino acid transporter SnatA (MarC family)
MKKKNNKKEKNKIIRFIIQSLIIFAVWFAGEILIYILDFEKAAAVSTGWTIVVIAGISLFRMIMSEKKDD